MHVFTPSQSKAGRTYVRWVQKDLAEAADLPVSAVKRFEQGHPTKPELIAKIQAALEKQGLRFAPNDSVRRDR